MSLRIEEIKPDRLSLYASIPMTVEVRSILVVEEVERGLGGLVFREERVDKPYIKDYDSYEDLYSEEKGEEGLPQKSAPITSPTGSPQASPPHSFGDPSEVRSGGAFGEGSCGPQSWPGHFDITNWGLFIALIGERPVGAAAVSWNTSGVNMLEGRTDIAVLWDIRVHPDSKGQSIGASLFKHAAGWTHSKGCKLLKIETQNVNVPACRFYVKQGCHLGQINRYGYWGHPQVGHEVMLIWYLDL